MDPIKEEIKQEIQNTPTKPRKRMTIRLPPAFEKTIIELELSLEKGQANQELIAMLLSLYSVHRIYDNQDRLELSITIQLETVERPHYIEKRLRSSSQSP